MWSSIFVIIAIAVASNLDNAGVGIAYGVRGVQISAIANTLIALISGAATLIAGFAGRVIVHYVPAGTATWIGGIVMMIVGLWVLLDPVRNRIKHRFHGKVVLTRILRDPMVADFDQSKTISLTEASVLGIALALNALAGGFVSGTAHIGIWVTALGVGAFSYVLLGVSSFVGRKYAAQWLGDKATFIAGLLLLLIGIHQIW